MSTSSCAEIFGTRLRELRNKKELSQQALCLDLGISKAALSYYENGQRVPDIDILRRVAEYFNVSADYLIGLNNNATNDKDIKDICEFTGLSEDVILNIIKSKDTTDEEFVIPLPLNYCKEIHLPDYHAPSISGLINWFFPADTYERNEWVDLFSLVLYYCYFAKPCDTITLKLIISDFFNEIFTSYRHSEEPSTLALWHNYPF